MEVILYDCNWKKVIAQNGTYVVPEVISLTKPKRHALSTKLYKTIGINLLILAFGGILYITSPVLASTLDSALKSKFVPLQNKVTFNEITKEEVKKEPPQTPVDLKAIYAEEAAKYGVPTDFSIVIPKINAMAKIISQVNPDNEKEYRAALMKGVAHSYGTGFPGTNSTIFLFAHSTNTLANVSKYNAVFYELKDLEPGDKIIVFFSGFKYTYTVTEKQTVGAKDTDWLTEDTGEERLVLSTCWPPGTTLKRLIVIAKPI